MDLNRLIQKAELHFGAACLGLMFAIICLNVVMRYVFSEPLYWAEEASDYLFVWIGFLSCAYAIVDEGHIRVTLVVDLFGPWIRRVLSLLMDALMLVVFVSFAPAAWRALDSLHISTGMQIHERYPYAIVPVTMGLCALHMAFKIWRDVRVLIAAGRE